MGRIKIGQIGIGHSHGEGKMLAVQKFPELFEVVGYADMKEKVDVSDVPKLLRYDEMMKDFYKSIIGEKVNPYSYAHEYIVQKTLRRVVGEN